MASCTHTELQPNVPNGEYGEYSYDEYDTMRETYWHFNDNQNVMNNDNSINFNILTFDWMEGENNVIFCFVLLFSCLIFFLIRHPNVVAQMLKNSTPRN